MAAKKKTARTAPKKTPATAARKPVKKAAARAPKLKPRRQPETLRLLIATNWLRTVAWTARAALVLHMLDRSARPTA